MSMQAQAGSHTRLSPTLVYQCNAYKINRYYSHADLTWLMHSYDKAIILRIGNTWHKEFTVKGSTKLIDIPAEHQPAF